MSKTSASTTATARLKQDYVRILRDPVPYVTAVPLTTNILTWHYVVKGKTLFKIFETAAHAQLTRTSWEDKFILLRAFFEISMSECGLIL